MRDRPTPLVLRDGYPFMVVDLGDAGGKHHLQIPSALTVAKLIKSLDQVHVAALLAMNTDGLDQARMLTMLREAGPELVAGFGALVGKAWADPDHELESEDQGDLIAYGEAVVEELHREGWRLDRLVLVSLTVIRAIYDQNQFSQEVKDRAAFFFRPRGRTSWPGSTSGSSTSETPGDSAN